MSSGSGFSDYYVRLQQMEAEAEAEEGQGDRSLTEAGAPRLG